MKWMRKNAWWIMAGFFLTLIAIRIAYIHRGYITVGGEYLTLPLILMIKQLVLDVREAISGEW